MPHYLFTPTVQKLGRLTFKIITTLSNEFDTSLTSTAIRAVETDHSPVVMVCHGQAGRKWFTRSPSVPDAGFPAIPSMQKVLRWTFCTAANSTFHIRVTSAPRHGSIAARLNDTKSSNKRPHRWG